MIDRRRCRHGQQPEIVGIEVDTVVGGQANGGLEFARQIGRAVDRLDIAAVGPPATSFAAGLGSVSQISWYAAGRGQDARPCDRPTPASGAHRIVLDGRRAAHDVTLDVAAGGQRRELDLVDAADRLLQVILQNAVQLQTLGGW